MTSLETAPGVIKKAPRLFITKQEVAAIFECSQSKAYGIVAEVNKCAKKNGNKAFPAGKASKYLFAQMYGIPLEEVNKFINNLQEE